jgi:type III pantothenate kinase
VIDAGTALTFTGADAQARLVGGAILPGLRLQLQALGDHTAALPQLAGQPAKLPQRWSHSTADAIWAGVLYTLLASLREFVGAWRSQYPTSAVLITGGDAVLLLELLHQQTNDLAAPIQLDPQLIFRGMGQVMRAETQPARLSIH